MPELHQKFVLEEREHHLKNELASLRRERVGPLDGYNYQPKTSLHREINEDEFQCEIERLRKINEDLEESIWENKAANSIIYWYRWLKDIERREAAAIIVNWYRRIKEEQRLEEEMKWQKRVQAATDIALWYRRMKGIQRHFADFAAIEILLWYQRIKEERKQASYTSDDDSLFPETDDESSIG